MDMKKKLHSLLQEAKIYESQGLLKEAGELYLNAGKLIKTNENLADNKNLLNSIAKKILTLKEQIRYFENAPQSIEMSEEVQNIIKDKLSCTANEETRELDGAIALVKFGQFKRALKELADLIQDASLRMEAAKNIFRCHRELGSLSEAVSLYEQWHSEELFTPDELENMRIFLQDILEKKGIDTSLPEVRKTVPEALPERDTLPGAALPEEEAASVPEGVPVAPAEEIEAAGEIGVPEGLSLEEIPDISSVEIMMTQGSRSGENIEFDVSFQSGKVINLLIPGNDEELAGNLEVGKELEKVRFYSPMAMFNGKGKVLSRSKIESGPKEGDYSLDIEISIK